MVEIEGTRRSLGKLDTANSDLLVVAGIPAYNEEKTIGRVVLGAREYAHIVVVCDDGSSDLTGEIAERLGAVVVRHERNFGKGAALRTGLSQVLALGFEWAVALDGDGQHVPDDLSVFLRCAERTGALLVVGNRMHNACAIPWLRRQVNRWMSGRLSRYAGRHLPDTQCGFRLIHLQTWSALPLKTEHFEVESEMLMAFLVRGYRIEFVPIQVIRNRRRSRIRPLADSLRWWKWWRSLERPSAHSAEIEGVRGGNSRCEFKQAFTR